VARAMTTRDTLAELPRDRIAAGLNSERRRRRCRPTGAKRPADEGADTSGGTDAGGNATAVA
jgi:hypothetical protein